MSDENQFPEFVREFPEIDLPLPGVTGWLVQGENSQVVFVEFRQTVEVPDHSHAAQWELAVAGEVELRREGRPPERIAAGRAFFIPAGQVHGATVHAGYRAIITFDEPGRYKVKS